MDVNEQLLHIRQSLGGLVPEIFLGIFFCLTLIAELLIRRKQDGAKTSQWIWKLCFAASLVTFGLVSLQWNGEQGSMFHSMLYLDKQAVFFKLIVLAAWGFALIHVRVLRYELAPEFYALMTVVVLGLCLLTMSAHLLTIYLSLETVSIVSYLLVSLSPYRKAAEGGIKYLLFGAVSSAVMLYGISMIYGLSGTMNITTEAIAAGLMNNSDFVIASVIILTLAGLLFKLSLVPFHVWTPDVYEAAPTPLVSFLSVAPKAAVILVLMRLASVLPAHYFPILGGVALISITFGNVAALWQKNARRLLAYSSIAQAGYLLVGVVAYSRFGFEAAVFYTAVYVLINMAAFFAIDLLQPDTATELDTFEGLGRRNVWIASMLTVIMIALAGLPPTAGFTSKLLIFSALWDSYHQQGQTWMLILLVGGLLNAAISLAYYLRLPYLLFFKEEKPAVVVPLERFSGKILAGLFLVAVLMLFFSPELLMRWISSF